MDTSIFPHLRAIAAAEVSRESPSLDYLLRHIFRWYSITFHTPLHQVPDLPLYDIVQAWYEHTFSEKKPEELEHEIEDIIMTDSQRKEHKSQKDVEDAQLAELEKMIKAEQEEKAKKAASAPITKVEDIKAPKDLPAALDGFKMSFLDLGETLDSMDPLTLAEENVAKNPQPRSRKVLR